MRQESRREKIGKSHMQAVVAQNRVLEEWAGLGIGAAAQASHSTQPQPSLRQAPAGAPGLRAGS